MPFIRRARPELTTVVVLLLMAGYLWIFYGLAVDLHQGMRTHRSDLGQIDQAVWNSSRGRFLEQTDNGFVATRMTDHVEPILIFISPVFWLWDNVRALLWIQTLGVALGAWPLYVLSRRQFDKFLSSRARGRIWEREPLQSQTRPLALALVLAYFLTPPLQSALLTEFHAAPLAVPLILWAFWAVDAHRWRQFVAAALLTASVKEEMALLAAGLGAWALWRCWWDGRLALYHDDRTHARPSPSTQAWEATAGAPQRAPAWVTTRGYWAGGLVLVLALAWFVIATFVIVPTHAAEVYGVAESTYFQRYGRLGDSPADILRSVFTQPQIVWEIASEPARVRYLLALLAPFGFLALLAPEIILLSLPLLLANLLSAYPAQYYGEFHYSAPVVAYMAAAAAYGTGRLWRWMAHRTQRSSSSFQHMPAAGSGTMAAASIWTNARTALRPLLTWALVMWILAWAATHYLAHGRGPLAGRYDPTPITAHHAYLPGLVAQIPDDAAVTATAAVHPHVSHRRFVYQFPLGVATDEDPRALGNATWALLDVTTNTDMAPGDLKARVDAMLAADWGVVAGVDGFLLLHKGESNKTIPQPFYDFVRVDQTREGAADFRQPLHLLDAGVDDWPRWRQTNVVATWQVGPGFDPDTLAPQLDITTPAGALVTPAFTPTPPALVWYPPEMWQAGDVIRITSLPLYLPRTFGLVTDLTVVADGEATTAPSADGTVLLAAYTREDDQLRRLPIASPAAADLARGGSHAPVLATLAGPDGAVLTLEADVHGATLWPDKVIDVWLTWRADSDVGWPDNVDAFVHLRQHDANIAQNDGRPRYFTRYAPAAEWAMTHPIFDWRQLAAGDDLSSETAQIVVGLYNRETGARFHVFTPDGPARGQEVIVASLKPGAPPVPDQACALIPLTCGAQ